MKITLLMKAQHLGVLTPLGIVRRNPQVLENPKDRGAWWAIIHGIAELDTTKHTACMRAYTHTHTHTEEEVNWQLELQANWSQPGNSQKPQHKPRNEPG